MAVKNGHRRAKSFSLSRASASGRQRKFMYALAACCAGLLRSSRRNVAGCGELMITRRPIASGRCAAQPPRQRAAPVVRDQRGELAAERVDQRRDVGDEMLGAIRLDVGGRRRALVAAQVGRDAAIACREVLEQLVPHERRLGKAVQEDEHRRADAAGGAAAERRCRCRASSVKVSIMASRWVQPWSTRAASSTPARLNDEKGVRRNVARLGGDLAQHGAGGLQRGRRLARGSACRPWSAGRAA